MLPLVDIPLMQQYLVQAGLLFGSNGRGHLACVTQRGNHRPALSVHVKGMHTHIVGFAGVSVAGMEDQEMTATFAVRSSVATEKAMICNRIDCLASLLGGCVTYAGDYPGWEYLRDSKLRDLVAEVYEKQTGKKPVIEAIHAGLECGVFAGKLPGLDCVSIGPDMEAIHTPKERLSIPTTQRTWELVCEVLRRSKEL